MDETALNGQFEAEKRAAGLRRDWEKEDDDRYELQIGWWMTLVVIGEDPVWRVWEYDHDAGSDENGRAFTSQDMWDDVYPTWIDAARDVESRRR